MKRLLDIVLSHPKKTIALLLCITVVLGSGVLKIQFDSSIDAVMPKHDPEYVLNEEIKKTYGNTGKFIIINTASDDMLKPGILQHVSDLHDDIEEYRRFDEAKEKQRLSLLQELSHNKELSKQTLMASFAHDPVFRRFILRTLPHLSAGNETVVQSEIKEIIKKHRASINVKKMQTIDIIISPFTMKDIKGENDTLYVRTIVDTDAYGNRVVPQTKEDINEFRKRLTNNPAYERGIYVRNEAGTITDFGILIRLVDQPAYDRLVKEIIDITSLYENNMTIILQGMPVTHHKINTYMKTDLVRFLPLVLLVVLFIFYLNFRTVRGMLLPFATVVAADLWVIGLMGHLGFKLNVIGVALPPLMTAVGSSYSIHILNQYFNEYKIIEKLGRKEGVKSALMHISITVLLAGLTTCIGFSTLITNQVSSIREMGLFSAIGVLFAVIISLTLIPAVLSLLPLKMKSSSAPGPLQAINSVKAVDAIVRITSHWAAAKSKYVIIIMLISLAVALYGMSKVKVESSIHAYFKEGDDILTSSKIIGQKFGGSVGLNILLETGRVDGVKDPEFLRFADSFREWLVSDENKDLNIGRTDAFTDFIKTMHAAMNNNDAAYYRIPDTQQDIDSYIGLFGGKDDNDNGLADEFEPYVDRTFQTVNIFARLWEREGKLLSSSTMHHIINRISIYLDGNLPQGYTYKISGEPKVLVKLSEYIVHGQIMSLTLSLVSIAFIILLLFNNWKASAVSLIPISTSVILNFGVMGFLGIRLDIATAIIASITIGIGIDDTIHFLNTYRKINKQKLSHADIIVKTLHRSGRAIMYTSIALIFGFLVLVISSFKPVIWFSLLLATTMITTTMGALLFLPAVINVFKLDLSPSEHTSKFFQYFSIGKYFEYKSD